MPPIEPVNLAAVVLTALLNPAVVLVAVWLGRYADQWQKLPVAAFAAALVGSALVFAAVYVGMPGVVSVGRATAGVFVSEFVFGLIWAALAWRFWPAAR
jgi:hypothetical protein